MDPYLFIGGLGQPIEPQIHNLRLTASWERGRPARTKPGTASAGWPTPTAASPLSPKPRLCRGIRLPNGFSPWATPAQASLPLVPGARRGRTNRH